LADFTLKTPENTRNLKGNTKHFHNHLYTTVIWLFSYSKQKASRIYDNILTFKGIHAVFQNLTVK